MDVGQADQYQPVSVTIACSHFLPTFLSLFNRASNIGSPAYPHRATTTTQALVRAMPPAQRFLFYSAPTGTLPATMQGWPQAVLFCRKSLSEFVLCDSQGHSFAQLIWQALASGGVASLWRLDVGGQPAAWCHCVDWPVTDTGAVAQHWFGGAYPSQQMPLGCVCWPEGASPPTWLGGIDPQPPLPHILPPPPPSMQHLVASMTDEMRWLRESVEHRVEEAWAAHDNRFSAIEHRMDENWSAQEESMEAYYGQSHQHMHDIAAQMQNTSDLNYKQMEARQKTTEDCCQEAADSATETARLRCQEAEEKADACAKAAVESTELQLKEAREELRVDVKGLVDQRVDQRVDAALRCVLQRVQGVQLSLLQATEIGLHNAITDGKFDEEESESTRSGSRSPRRVGQWV
jgi:hypothetical protein